MNAKILFYYFCQLIKIDCVGCSSLLPTKSGLCFKCQKHLNHYKISHQQSENIISLYSWKPNASDLISSYVYYLKSHFAQPGWITISHDFLNLEPLKLNFRETLIVPIPSSTGRNHSLYFAKSLSELTNTPYKQVLNYVETEQSNQSQKHKNKQERAEQSFTLDEKFTEFIQSYQRIIFVDDIITTGATYKAAKKAVKQCLAGSQASEDMHFFLWTAFKREKTETRC